MSPSIWYEYIWDCARLLKDRGQKVVLVTNGYIEARPLNQLLPFIDALNIDVKAFTNDFYKKLCKGTLAPVINTVEEAAARAHVEITTLIIPGDNDQLEHIDAMAKWLASIRSTIPLHLSRYHPAYKYDRPPTPEATLIKARQTAMAHLPLLSTSAMWPGAMTPGALTVRPCLSGAATTGQKWCIMKQGAVAPVGQQLIILSAESALKNDCPE